ncbi:CHAT domain-containing protein [Streptomyces sp. F001]|nr:CHAT domain-containing protein [Streptomyces sp. F001]
MRGRAVTSAVQLGDVGIDSDDWYRAAVVRAEGTKSLVLTGLLGRTELPAPPEVPAAEVAREADLARRLAEIDRKELATVESGASDEDRRALALRRRKILLALSGIWESIGRCGPAARSWVSLRRGDTPTWEELCELAVRAGPDTPLVSLFAAHDRIVLAVLRADALHPAVVNLPLDGPALAAVEEEFAVEVDPYGVDLGPETWYEPLIDLWQQAAPFLAGARRLVIVPHGVLHRLPWAVVTCRAGIGDAAGRPLPIYTVPSLQVARLHADMPPLSARNALVVGDPRGDLGFARLEAERVAKILRTEDTLIGERATISAVLDGLSKASVAHIGAHAIFDPAEPLSSGLSLADGMLTVRRLLEHRSELDLLVLSACSTGRSAALGGDELLGLTTAFLQAGARQLVVSLWPVLDATTIDLMGAFHTAHRAGKPVAEALRDASVGVRAHHPHGYYWGAFTAVGAPRQGDAGQRAERGRGLERLTQWHG